MNQENEPYTEHYLKHACIIDTPKEQRTSMRMDYLHAAERADNLMECLNLIQLIDMEIAKFESGEYKDEQYKQELKCAKEIVIKKFNNEDCLNAMMNATLDSIQPDANDPVASIDFSHVTRLKCYPKDDNNEDD